MEHPSKKSWGTSRTTLVLEFQEGVTADAYPVSIVASIRGTDDTLVRSWGVPGRMLSPSQYTDLQAFVQELVHDRFVALVGLQGELGYG